MAQCSRDGAPDFGVFRVCIFLQVAEGFLASDASESASAAIAHHPGFL
jgi:hypothetical protein